MNVIVALSRVREKENGNVHFGRCLTSPVRESMDHLAQTTIGVPSYVQFLVAEMEAGRSGWNPDGFFTVPEDAKGMVFFWNYTEAHWMLIHTRFDLDGWTHTIYNSWDRGMKGPAWNYPRLYLPLLERLVGVASGREVSGKGSIEMGLSFQQSDDCECGVITVWNCVELLSGRSPAVAVDTNELRLRYLSLILEDLERRIGCLNVPMEADGSERED